jgi:hypothetical protein
LQVPPKDQAMKMLSHTANRKSLPKAGDLKLLSFSAKQPLGGVQGLAPPQFVCPSPTNSIRNINKPHSADVGGGGGPSAEVGTVRAGAPAAGSASSESQPAACSQPKSQSGPLTIMVPSNAADAQMPLVLASPSEAETAGGPCSLGLGSAGSADSAAERLSSANLALTPLAGAKPPHAALPDRRSFVWKPPNVEDYDSWEFDVLEYTPEQLVALVTSIFHDPRFGACCDNFEIPAVYVVAT